jgi:hypothetical protein
VVLRAAGNRERMGEARRIAARLDSADHVVNLPCGFRASLFSERTLAWAEMGSARCR